MVAAKPPPSHIDNLNQRKEKLMVIKISSKRILILLLITLIILVVIIGSSTIQRKEFELTLLLKSDDDFYSPLNDEIVQMNGYIIHFPFRKYYVKGTAMIRDTEFMLNKYFYRTSIKPGVDLFTMEMYTSEHNYSRTGGVIFTIGSILDDSLEQMMITITGYPDPEIGFTTTYNAFPLE